MAYDGLSSETKLPEIYTLILIYKYKNISTNILYF
jgi:hypothetical protein